MIKPISIAALQKFFFMARIILLVVSIGEKREAPLGTWLNNLHGCPVQL
jgi:hypothetical protein